MIFVIKATVKINTYLDNEASFIKVCSVTSEAKSVRYRTLFATSAYLIIGNLFIYIYNFNFSQMPYLKSRSKYECIGTQSIFHHRRIIARFRMIRVFLTFFQHAAPFLILNNVSLIRSKDFLLSLFTGARNSI